MFSKYFLQIKLFHLNPISLLSVNMKCNRYSENITSKIAKAKDIVILIILSNKKSYSYI